MSYMTVLDGYQSACRGYLAQVYSLSRTNDPENNLNILERVNSLHSILISLQNQSNDTLHEIRLPLQSINRIMSKIEGALSSENENSQQTISGELLDLDKELNRCIQILNLSVVIDIRKFLVDFPNGLTFSWEVFNQINSNHSESMQALNHIAILLQNQTAPQNNTESLYTLYPLPVDYNDERSVLGRGTFGTTHRMKNIFDDGIYAVKVIRVKDAEEFVDTNDIKRETLFLQRMNHNHIVRYFTSFFSQNKQKFYLVMELLSSDTLAKKIKDLTVSFDVILMWWMQLASALCYMHCEMRIQHRDIKPENILLTNQNDVKIIDLGLACIVKSRATKVSKVGTSTYSSYQKAHELPYDGRDDVWGLGCVIAELITKKRLSEFGGAIYMHTTPAVNDRRILIIKECKSVTVYGIIVEQMLQPLQENRITALKLISSLNWYGQITSAPGVKVVIKLQSFLRMICCKKRFKQLLLVKRANYKKFFLCQLVTFIVMLLLFWLTICRYYATPDLSIVTYDQTVANDVFTNNNNTSIAEVSTNETFLEMSTKGAPADDDPNNGYCYEHEAHGSCQNANQNVVGHLEGIGLVQKNDTEAFKYFLLAANGGNAEALNNVGFSYQNGVGVTQNMSTACHYYNQSAVAGNALGQMNLGYCYFQGDIGDGVNETEAFRWIKLAADSGSVDAMFDVGFCYEHGKGVKANHTEACQWYKQSADLGNAPAQNSLGICYEGGIDVVKSDVETVEYFSLSSNAGNADAYFNDGYHYEYGKGVTKNLIKACALYQQSADLGHAPGQNGVGNCYLKGIGVAKNDEEAFRYFTLSAIGGNAEALKNVGNCYQSGVGVAKNMSIACHYYNQSAIAGNAEGQKNLGYCFFHGDIGDGVNETEAFRWIKLAADRGNAVAMFDVGYIYENGKGVKANHTEACRWYKQSADLGNAPAQNSLGICYEGGIGVVKSDVKAFKYFSLSSNAGNAEAKNNIGHHYEHGKAVTKNLTAACLFYQQSADLGNAEGQKAVGNCYLKGIGVEKNNEEAFRYFTLSVNGGNAEALKNVGYCYQYGVGVAKNMRTACYYYNQSAIAGNAGSQKILGYCYLKGYIGTGVDEKEAFRWFKLSADSGNTDAMYNVGFCYEHGKGVFVNPAEACLYYRKAADLGNAQALNSFGVCYLKGFGAAQH